MKDDAQRGLAGRSENLLRVGVKMGDWREVVAKWQGGTAFIGSNASGGSVQMGTIGDHPGISPMELLLIGLAGCTGSDVASILEKERQPLSDLKVTVRGRRADDFPRVYQEIHVEYLLWGNGLDPKAVQRAVDLSERKYCSASAMLQATAKIQSSIHIFPLKEVESLHTK